MGKLILPAVLKESTIITIMGEYISRMMKAT
jgi:hypothetical protein